MKGKKRLFTVMVVPHSAGKVWRVKFTRFTLALLAGGFIGILFLLGIFLYQYGEMKYKLLQVEKLERINEIQRKKILSLAEKLKEFNLKLEKLRELEKRLRILAGVGGEGYPVENLGRGGPSEGSKEEWETISSTSDLVEEISCKVESLDEEAREREKSLSRVREIIEGKINLFAATPNIFPVKGWISTGFQWRRDPFTGKRKFHKALDIVAPWGSPVRAAARGRVIFQGWDGSYGLKITISHGYGYKTVYGHLSRILVHKGQWVKKGEIIGNVGSTGRSTGPHLHFEVWKRGKPINPLNLMVEPLR